MTHNDISSKQLIVYVIHNQDYVFVTQFLSDFRTLIDTTNILFFATLFIPTLKINNKLSLVSSNNVIHVGHFQIKWSGARLYLAYKRFH